MIACTEIKQAQAQDRKTHFETVSLPVAKILSPVARQAPTKVRVFKVVLPQLQGWWQSEDQTKRERTKRAEKGAESSGPAEEDRKSQRNEVFFPFAIRQGNGQPTSVT